MMKQKISILSVILIFIFSASYLWWYQAIKPTNPSDSKSVTFSVRRGESVRSIAERLQKENLIRSSVALFIMARFGSLSESIQAGDFRLNPSMNLREIATNLTHGTDDVWITIPEGWRKEEIALILAQELSIPESDFNKYAKEGFMFPETYLVPKDSSASAVAKLMTETFYKKVPAKDIDLANQKGLTLNGLITIASLVEREAKLPEDRPLIASVILNRIRIGMKLDIDATIQYALGYQSDVKSWWKKNLTLEDLEIISPYNTYKNPGLPPGPIANPGLSAIKAVINAPETDYLFYVADKAGRSHFAKNLDGHNSNISRYLNK